MDWRGRYEERFRAVRIRRDVAEKLEEICRGRSMPDCVSEILERILAGGQQATTGIPQLPVDCKAVRYPGRNLYYVNCGGKQAIIPSFSMGDFIEKLGVSVEFVGGIPEELSRPAPRRAVVAREETEEEEEEE